MSLSSSPSIAVVVSRKCGNPNGRFVFFRPILAGRVKRFPTPVPFRYDRLRTLWIVLAEMRARHRLHRWRSGRSSASLPSNWSSRSSFLASNRLIPGEGGGAASSHSLSRFQTLSRPMDVPPAPVPARVRALLGLRCPRTNLSPPLPMRLAAHSGWYG